MTHGPIRVDASGKTSINADSHHTILDPKDNTTTAMRPRDRRSLPAKPSEHQFQTPARPSLNRRATTKTSRRTTTPIPSNIASRSRKRNSSSLIDPRAHYVDFVGRTQDADEEDDELDYIDDTVGNDTRGGNEVTGKTDGVDDGPDYRTSSNANAQPRRRRTPKFDQQNSGMPNRKNNISPGWRGKGEEMEHQRRNRKKSETPRASTGAKSGSGSGKKSKDKQRKEGNKTLTQMDFVQRWVKIESDDDEELSYFYSPKREDSRRKSREVDARGDEHGSASKRRKLDEGDSNEVKNIERIPLEPKPSNGPITPQKPRKLEIPSSQSPESPGFAIISSSQFRSAARSPLKHISTNVPRAQEESPGWRQEKKASQASPAAVSRTAMMHDSQIVRPPSPDVPLENSPMSSRPLPKSPILGNPPNWHDNAPANTATSGKTVVYDTDAEFSDEDSQDNLPSAPSPQKEEPGNDDDQNTESYQGVHGEDSQELPPIPDQDTGSGHPHSELPLSSDASVCYRRIERPTQYPLEPIPQLNTQKLAELFPQDNSTRAPTIIGSETQSSPATRSHTMSDPQTETKTREMENTSTEMVPESSPVVWRDEETPSDPPVNEEPRHRPVIQVESSQPADRFNLRGNWNQGSHPRRLLSRNQLLTSSVMESVPMPQFMMGSQDSVGEPYSLADGEQ